MIIVMKPSALPQDVDKIVDAVEKEGLKTEENLWNHTT